MPIHRKPKSHINDINLAEAQRFVEAANSPTPPPNKLSKMPVALRFDPALLTAIDAMAHRRGMSRNAIISYWCSRGVEGEQ
jgi:predicted HicB family RNase H-like nuclease